ncbi:MAG: hypothetical protein JWL90_103 [Chthoniobacteraceae bacterium]|nr:hypothetical protein [Chthoniobacteraceae bacterium]
MARCWYDAGKKWESLAAYDRVVSRYPKSEFYEPALFAEVSVFAELHGRQSNEPCEGCTGIAATVRPSILRTSQTQQLCERYLKEFPDGPNAGTVGYLSGAVALEAEDPVSAEKYFTEILEKQPTTPYREEIRFLLGNAKFMQGNFEQAQKDYQDYIKDYPQGQYLEDVTYRVAVAQVFAGKFEEALPALATYLEKFPKGQSVADVKYRIAVCKYAAQNYVEVIAACNEWFTTFPNNPQEGEVQALLGDCYAAQNKLEEAVPVYLRSYKTAATDEVMNYSLFEASKHLQKLGRWSDLAKMFEEFVRDKPDSTSVVAAMYWIGKSKVREGKSDEAKAFFVETLKKYIAEPKREAVEQLLSQLAQLCAKKPRPIPPPPAAAPVAPAQPEAATAKTTPETALPVAPPPEPPAPPYDPVAELEKQLAPLEENANPTTQARLLYARAELAAARKQPEEQERIYREMADRFKPQDLSPVLLANVGDYLFQIDDRARAEIIYTRLKDNFLKSDYLDFAYVGLGEIAFGKKDYAKALELFTDALEKIAASMKVKEATIGRAKTLLELGDYDESKKLFEQVAGVREWRGESTAMAIYQIGEVEARRGNWNEAIAHYRRVFVAYQKFSPWVAKAYLRSAESFDKMGKRKDAIDSLREMLRIDKLKQFPEVEEAKKRLEEWGAPVA